MLGELNESTISIEEFREAVNEMNLERLQVTIDIPAVEC